MTDNTLNNNKKCYNRRQQEQHTINKNDFKDNKIFLRTKTIMTTAITNEQNLSKKFICNTDVMKSLCAFQLILFDDFFHK